LAATDGFIRAIRLGKKKWSANVQQDLLNLMTIWFRYGVNPEVRKVLSDPVSGLSSVMLDTWLGVVPQLIACINHRHPPTRELLHDLLMRLGRRHPQALVYPLSVALNSPKQDRKIAAEKLMAALQQYDSALVQ
ncbi:unnamed protein product, partial [Discosporangium mesarthrocarpum]